MKIKATLREILADPDVFILGAEVVTSRGIITQQGNQKIRALARELVASPSYHTINFTDNAGGMTAFSPETLLEDVLAAGGAPILHLTCKDKNRAALESIIFKLASKGLENILALTGDAPISGFQGTARKSFDFDSVNLVVMLRQMNEGLVATRPSGKSFRYDPTNFLIGVAVSPYKESERELIPQYIKLEYKIQDGAHFIIPQLGYDSRKLDELLRYLRHRQIERPVIGNVFVLSRGPARAFHANRIPGCVCTDDLLALVEKQAKGKDRGKAFFLEFAAKQVAIAKGVGCKGAYIGGIHRIRDFEKVAEIWKTFGPDDWKDFAREVNFAIPEQFHFFAHDPDTGLNTDQLDEKYAESITVEGRRAMHVPLSYRASDWIHDKVFEPGAGAFALGRKVYRFLDEHRRLAQTAHFLEHTVKGAIFACRDCGDCSLPDLRYLCPESQCGKNQRNGACGGTSRGGRCEVDPEKTCIYSRMYEIEKALALEYSLLERPVVFTDGDLQHTSAWRNAFLSVDHIGRRRKDGQEQPEGDEKE